MLPILAPKLGPIRLLLLQRPLLHLPDAKGDKHHHSPAPAHGNDADPGNHLKHVVWTRDNVETVALRDLSHRGTLGPQAREVKMHHGIAGLAVKVDCEPHVVNKTIFRERSLAGGRVDEVRHQDARESPVKDTVLEDVEGGHGGRAETVDEEGLELTFEEVAHYHAEHEILRGRHGEICFEAAAVEQRTRGHDEEMNHNGTEIFCQEHCAPCYLRPCCRAVRPSLASGNRPNGEFRGILFASVQGRKESLTQIPDQQLLGLHDRVEVPHQRIAVLERLARGRVEEADAIVVTNAGLASY